MLQSYLICKDNLEETLVVQHKIFPREDGRVDYEESIKVHEGLDKNSEEYRMSDKYYLVKNENGEKIGLWGIYTEKSPEEAWLGWFGVLPKFRNNGYGSEIMEIFIEFCKQHGFKRIRLYTDEVDNNKACKLYEKFGMTKEYYLNPNDVTKEIGAIIIYSKSLDGTPCEAWNNRFINLKGQEKKQEFYKK